MLRLMQCLVIALAIFSVVPCVAGERALLQPDWDDPKLASPRSNFESRARSFAAPAAEPGKELSLPRWGFGNDLQNPTQDERSRSLAFTQERSARAFPWPECASRTPPHVDRVDGANGDSYTDTYHYGCILLIISGDRAYNKALKVPAQEGADVSECPASSDENPNEPEDDSKDKFELQITLNHIPYTIRGECYAGAKEFCKDRSAQCELIRRRIFAGGTRR